MSELRNESDMAGVYNMCRAGGEKGELRLETPGGPKP